jgi:dipeptide transport system substrate-binding protein
LARAYVPCIVSEPGTEELLEQRIQAYLNLRYQKLKASECHVMPYPNPADIEEIRVDPALRVLEAVSLDFGYLALNTEKTPLDDRRVRQAINLAIDKEALFEAVYLGIAGRPATTPVPPVLAGHNDALRGYKYNPAGSRKLLAEAGYPAGFTATLSGRCRSSALTIPTRAAWRS